MTPSEPDGPFDVVVVGGGPVGLHAALKAAVLNHRVLVVDKGRRFSRAVQAKAIANVPGMTFASGEELLERGREDVRAFEEACGKDLVTFLEDTEATWAAREPRGGFRVRVRSTDGDGREREVVGRVLVLATGVVDRKPGVERYYAEGHETLAPRVHRGDVGYCLLCEGWSFEGRRVGVVGASRDSAQIALDVHDQFAGDVALLTDGEDLESEDDAERLAEAGVPVEERAVRRLEDEDGGVRVTFAGGDEAKFDKVLLALGWYKANNELAVELGAATTRDGYVVTSEDSEALDADGRPIEGLYVVGDLRAGRWKQVVVGWGDAETAIISAYAKRLPSRAEMAADARR